MRTVLLSNNAIRASDSHCHERPFPVSLIWKVPFALSSQEPYHALIPLAPTPSIAPQPQLMAQLRKAAQYLLALPGAYEVLK